MVGAGDSGGCVLDANSDQPSTAALKPAGGNVGAQATGYRTGPDAQALPINRNNDTVTIRLDQRIDPAVVRLERIFLVGPNGNSITSPSQATVPTQGPGPQSVTLDFGGSEIPDGTVGIRLDRSALQTFDGPSGSTARATRPRSSLPSVADAARLFVAERRERARNEDAQSGRVVLRHPGRVPRGPEK